jgi:hypothetical protein
MEMSENALKWLMRFYPPFLTQRIWVKKIHKDFRQIDVKINRSLLTTNLGKSTFGGTIFSATDPFYALLLNQIVKREGMKPVVWLKSAQINYLKPADTDLHFSLKIDEELIAEMFEKLRSEGRFVKELPIHIYNNRGELCVTAMNEVYVRDTNYSK